MTKRKTTTAPAAEKALTPAQLDNAIQPSPDAANGGWYGGWPGGVLTLSLAHEADEIPAWGTDYRARDRKLRELWPTEPTLAGALATLAARNAAMGIVLDGPDRSVNACWDLLHGADKGAGIAPLVTKLSFDIYTQDNCAYLGIAREKTITGRKAMDLYDAGKPLPAVVGLEHLDASNCIRTGDPLEPVLYIDSLTGGQHLLPWHMVHVLAEMPSPVWATRGLQYSALTRVLKAAQFMRDVTIYRREKVSGRNPSQIQIVGGPSNQAIEDAKALARERGDNRGFLRYMEPLIIASLDPTRPVSVETLEWASLPEGFDYDTELKNYITILALGLLEDYQTFAPLTGGALGAGQQSVTLERKGRGKGPGLWRKLFSHMMNFYGILPRNVEFSFDETDVLADKEQADADAAKIKNVTDMLTAGIITASVAQQMLNDAGVLDDDYLAMLGSADQTPDTTRTDDETAAAIDTEGVLMTGTVPLAVAPTAPAPVAAPVTAAKDAGPLAALTDALQGVRRAVLAWRYGGERKE